VSLPSNSKARKVIPIFSGVLKYFPDAIAAVAHTSYVGNEQHHPDTELHWDRSKSKDEYDACARHLVDRAEHEFDYDGQRHMAKVAWRALAALQKEIENSNSQKIATPAYECKYCGQVGSFNPDCGACLIDKYGVDIHPYELDNVELYRE
jgi:hypothetical protein